MFEDIDIDCEYPVIMGDIKINTFLFFEKVLSYDIEKDSMLYKHAIGQRKGWKGIITDFLSEWNYDIIDSTKMNHLFDEYFMIYYVEQFNIIVLLPNHENAVPHVFSGNINQILDAMTNLTIKCEECGYILKTSNGGTTFSENDKKPCIIDFDDFCGLTCPDCQKPFTFFNTLIKEE